MTGDPPPAASYSTAAVTNGFLVGCGLLLFLALCLIYVRAFGVQPAADDFGPPLTEVHRGNVEGALALVTRSPQVQRYRPLQSVLIWLSGNINPEWPWPWIRLLGLLCHIPLLAATLLWARSMRRSRLGVATAAVVMVIHPGLAGPLASIDGFSSQLSMGVVWLGLWIAFTFGKRPAVGAAMIGGSMVLAILTKEYSVGIVPLAILMGLCLRKNRPVAGAMAMAFAAVVVIAGFMLLRHWVAPPEDDGVTSFFSFDPLSWAQQEAMLLTAALYPGNTVWVFVKAGVLGFSVLIMGGGLYVAWMMVGIHLEVRTQRSAEVRRGESQLSPYHWLTFLVLALFASGTPGCLVWKVSEMYAVGMILPVALLSAMAVDGWRKAPGLTRLAGLSLGTIAIIVAVISTVQKIEGVRGVGERATHQLQQLVALLPPDLRNQQIALVYREDQLPLRRKYSVFHLGDDHLLTTLALDWPMYGHNLKVKKVYVTPNRHVELQQFAHAYLWQADQKRFEPITASQRDADQ